MKMVISILTLLAALLCPTKADADQKLEWREFLLPPFPAVSILALLMPEGTGEIWQRCRIGLLRNDSADARFPGDPTVDLSRFLFLNVEAEGILKEGGARTLTFFFPVSHSGLPVLSSAIMPHSCDEVSHLVVVKASCRLEGDQIGQLGKKVFRTLDKCIPGLPRRLDFFANLETDGIAPFNDQR